jgi:hypothetical protein
MEMIISLVAGILLGACFLWVGMKVTKVEGTFLKMLGVAAASSLIGLVPLVGWLLSIIVMFLLIRKLTDAEIWPDAVLMVLVAGGVSILGGMLLMSVLSNV